MDKDKVTAIGGMIAGGIGSVCCIGPAVLAGLGFGSSIMSFVRELGVFHFPMTFLAFLLLGAAIYFHHRGESKSNTGEVCCQIDSRKTNSKGAVVWTAAGLTLFFVLLPYLL